MILPVLKPFLYQLPFWHAMDNGCKRAILSWPRRSGMDRNILDTHEERIYYSLNQQMENVMDKMCEMCETQFTTQSNGRYCSDECKEKSAKKRGVVHQKRSVKRKAEQAYRDKNKDKLNMIKLSYRMRLKHEVLAHYSSNPFPCCARCGETDPDMLVLDHINDDGREHRERLSIASRDSNGGVIRGQRSYEVYKKNGYPDGLQVLCANCNTKKQICKNREGHKMNEWYDKYINREGRLSWIRDY